MLDFVRRHSRSWGIKVLLIALIIVFIGWGGYLYQTRHATDIAVVGDHYITQSEYQKEYENMVEMVRKQFGGTVPQKLMEALDIRRQALDALVRQYLVLRGARELGLQATPEQVRTAIAGIPAFQSNGKFDLGRYRAVLFQNRMTPEMFEEEMGDEITATNVQAFITGQAVVSREEIESYYHFNNDRIQLAYMLFDPYSFEKGVAVDESALKAYYKKHQNNYMEPEKREIAYVVFNTKELENSINPGESQIKQYYNDNAADFMQPEEVRAQRILVRLKPDASKAELQKAGAQAEKILGEAQKGEDFSALAKKYSQDQATAKNGGELGFFSYKQKDPAFAKAAFALKPGEMSGIVRTPSGLNIIKVEEVKKAGISPLEQVKDQVVKDLKHQEAGELAYRQAQNLRDLAYARKDLGKAALELKMKASAPVWITLSEKEAQGSPFDQSVREKLFGLGQGDISDMLKISGGYAVAQVQAIQKPAPAPLEKVKSTVTNDFRMAEARKLALKQAAAMLQKARAQKNLAAAAKTDKIDFLQSQYFSRQDANKYMPQLKGENLESVFKLQESRPFPERPLEYGTSYMICQLMGKKPAGAPTRQQEEQISAAILQQKQAAVWRTWLGEIAKKTKVEYLQKI